MTMNNICIAFSKVELSSSNDRREAKNQTIFYYKFLQNNNGVATYFTNLLFKAFGAIVLKIPKCMSIKFFLLRLEPFLRRFFSVVILISYTATLLLIRVSSPLRAPICCCCSRRLRYKLIPFKFQQLIHGFYSGLHRQLRGRDSSVGIATCYGLDGSGIESRLKARFSSPFQTSPGAHPASYTMGTGSFPGVKRSGRGVDHPPQRRG